MPDWIYYDQHPGLREAAVLLKTITNVLNLPNVVVDYSMRIYELLYTRKLTQGRRREELVGACIYLSCLGVNYPVKLKDLCKASETNKKNLIKQKKFIKQFIKTNEEGITPEAYISRYTHELGLSEKDKTRAYKALKKIKKELTNHKDRIKAAVAIYQTSKEEISIRQLARITGLSRSGIYEAYKKIKQIRK